MDMSIFKTSGILTDHYRQRRDSDEFRKPYVPEFAETRRKRQVEKIRELYDFSHGNSKKNIRKRGKKK